MSPAIKIKQKIEPIIEARINSSEKMTFETMDNLYDYPYYNNINWLHIEHVTFQRPFYFPTHLEQLYVSHCSHCNFKKLPVRIFTVDITESKLENAESFLDKDLLQLETLNLSCNRIKTIPTNIPPNLVTLNLNTNEIKHFPETNIFLEASKLEFLDLGYNQMDDLPQWLSYIDNKILITVMPNKFWFNHHCNISLNRKVELWHIKNANIFFNGYLGLKLVNIYNHQNQIITDITDNPRPIRRLHNHNDGMEGPAIEYIRPQNGNVNPIRINHTIGIQTTAEQGQNVHNSSIQQSFRDAVKVIMDHSAPIDELFIVDMVGYYIFDGFNICSNFFILSCIHFDCKLQSVVSANGVTYKELLQKIWAISTTHEHKHEIRGRLREEIQDGAFVCFTGKITRLVNVLTGFIDNVQIGYSENEQINNAVIATIRRCEKENIEDVAKEVKEVLDGLKIPDERQKIWLDAL